MTLARGDREELHTRRGGESIDFEQRGIIFSATAGYYPDGRIAEIFLNAGKDGSILSVLVHDAAVLTSLLLQYGCPVDVIRSKVMRNPDNSAAGPVGALLDFLADDPTVAAEA